MNTLSSRLHYILRVACAMCFIGHGAFGIITKQVWCNYFAVFGIGEDLAYQLMPFIGITDIMLGIVLLLYPVRMVAGWLVVWGLFTAMLRPLSGEPFAEFIERAGNYGAPLVLLILSGTSGMEPASWFKRIKPEKRIISTSIEPMIKGLQLFAFMILAGHGWLNLIEKKGLVDHYATIGFNNPVLVSHIIGSLEFLGALSILIKPMRPIILLLIIWKMASEIGYPNYALFEWIERGGSYGVLLALWLALKDKVSLPGKVSSRSVPSYYPKMEPT